MKEYIERADIKALLERYGATDDAMALIDTLPAAAVAEVRHAEWKYYHKQNKAVCTNCSFERDLDTDIGRCCCLPQLRRSHGQGGRA